MSPSRPKIRLDLQRLDALPLSPSARAILWRELLSLVGDGESELAAELKRRLVREDLRHLRNRCLAGDWLQGLRRLEGLGDLAMDLGLEADLADGLVALLPELHRVIIDAPQESLPSPSAVGAVVACGERDELLWLAHGLLQRLEALPGDRPGRLAVIAEQIARYGAVAWRRRLHRARHAAGRLEALQRSQALLLDLAGRHDPCPEWVGQALGEGLRLALGGDDPLSPTPAQLLCWARGYVEHGAPAQGQDAAHALVGQAEAALEVGRGLRLKPFASHGSGRT